MPESPGVPAGHLRPRCKKSRLGFECPQRTAFVRSRECPYRCRVRPKRAVRQPISQIGFKESPFDSKRPRCSGSGGALSAIGVPMAEFMKLTKIPIVIYYGDFIPDKPSDYPGQDGWRVRLEMARKWRETVNRHGGDGTGVHLPEDRLHGNNHFPFSGLNNKQQAEVLSKFLSEKKLD